MINKNIIADSRHMRCPRCEELYDILQFIPLVEIEDYAKETNPIYKCPGCKWLFSPALTIKKITLGVVEGV